MVLLRALILLWFWSFRKIHPSVTRLKNDSGIQKMYVQRILNKSTNKDFSLCLLFFSITVFTFSFKMCNCWFFFLLMRERKGEEERNFDERKTLAGCLLQVPLPGDRAWNRDMCSIRDWTGDLSVHGVSSTNWATLARLFYFSSNFSFNQ